ncbi:YjcZ family sporulation protein [Camelliibacillus cellulosilyticus]|uniref:YjcZ family sporulation protein n=1 Tax=Camelliibacillus cellulosilyticus TaxID=2174486 RepID=A0ABV9GRJ1_9BACL
MVMPYGYDGYWGPNAAYGGWHGYGCGCDGYGYGGYGGYGINSFALIVVLFILLIIVGTAYVY